MIYFQKGFKYQLIKDYSLNINIQTEAEIVADFIKLSPNGLLMIKKGYAWDGASGPTIDTNNCLRGSLVHDVLYQLMRHQLVDLKHREYVDKLFESICIEDGMFKWRARLWYWAVRVFGKGTSRYADRRKTFVAPRP